MTATKDKPVCHVRRHLTPSLFMTYDTMRAMAKKPDFQMKPGAIIKTHFVCYARLTTICNHNSLSRNQNRAQDRRSRSARLDYRRRAEQVQRRTVRT